MYSRSNAWGAATAAGPKADPIPHTHASQIKTTGRNLCLTTPGNKYLNLTRCDENDKEQLFEGIKENGERFEWGSYGEKLQVKRCLTPHHHPRKGELIFKENCEKARITKSSFWMKYKPSSVLSLREYGSNDCFAGNPCGECSGDCDDDSSCDGDLKCFQRDNFERVPGCAGNGQDGKNPFIYFFHKALLSFWRDFRLHAR